MGFTSSQLVLVQPYVKPLSSELWVLPVFVEPAVLFWEIFLFVLDIKYLKGPFWCVSVWMLFFFVFPIVFLPSSTDCVSNFIKGTFFFLSCLTQLFLVVWATSFWRWNLHLLQIFGAFFKSSSHSSSLHGFVPPFLLCACCLSQNCMEAWLRSSSFPLHCSLRYCSCGVAGHCLCVTTALAW